MQESIEQKQGQITDQQLQKQQDQSKYYSHYRLHLQSKHRIVLKYNSLLHPLVKVKILTIKNQEAQTIICLLKQRIHIINHLKGINSLLSYGLSPQMQIKKVYNTSIQTYIHLQAQYISNPTLIQFFNKYYSPSAHKQGINPRMICQIFKKSLDYPILHYQLIPTYQNIFVNYDTLQLSFNHLSLTGLELIIFQKPICRQQFTQIYPFLYGGIFERKKSERINFFMYQRLLALLILSMIVGKPILYEQNENFGDMIGVQQAKKYVDDLKRKFKKLLYCKSVKNKIQISQRQSGLKFFNFLFSTLAQESELSISEITKVIIPLKNEIEQQQVKQVNDLESQLFQIARQMWLNLDAYTKKQLLRNRIISLKTNEKLNEVDYEIFILYYFNVDFKVIYQYRSLARFLLKSLCNQYTHNITHKLIYQLQKNTEKSQQIPSNSTENIKKHKKMKDTRLYVENLQKVFRVVSTYKLKINNKCIIVESPEQRSIRQLMKSMHLQ